MIVASLFVFVSVLLGLFCLLSRFVLLAVWHL